MKDTDKLTRLLGEKIKAIRKEMKLKQSAFARLAGTSDDTISLMERGKILPRLETLYKIAEHLHIPIEDLLTSKGQAKTKKSHNQPLSALNLYLRTKTPEQVKMIHDIAKNIFDMNTFRHS